MSEGEDEKLDISTVVSKIMEHPELVEKISDVLAEKSESFEEPKETAKSEEIPVFMPKNTENDNKRRQKLLGALRPYLSSERVKLLDSMSAVLDLMEAMGRGG